MRLRIDLNCNADVAVSYQIGATPPAGIPASSGVVATATGAGQAAGVGVQIRRANTAAIQEWLAWTGGRSPFTRQILTPPPPPDA